MHFPKFLIQCPTSAAPTVVWLYPTTRPVSLIRKVSVRSFQTHHRLNPLFNEQKQKDSTQDTNIKPSRANEILEAVLYGSKKVKEIEQQTHSKMLARGKYVHELQIHRVKPDKVDEYIELVSKHLPKIANDPLNEVNLCGSWSVDIGEQDTFIHIWEYKGYPGRRRTHENLQTQKDHRHYSKKLKDLVRSRENHIMLEFSFWQTSPPKVTNGIFELRKYNLKPGRLLEWEMNW
ncbi:hypothetical protein BDF20DRAFT_7104 [Mycotypha africana]|uniref:uncharacterized protein n=1 Tax=Mycotypha africana TaxID=64632 RepID=UPI0023006222|nr:uncharacterized protein BDF20DRAFT_7104 [Mycotypha africana]KAI8990883.1 hypothetical protein BDF20DRAFT_7104 [Mycotypha africana]